MITFLATVAAIASVLGYAGALAFATRLWSGVVLVGIALLLVVLTPVLAQLAALPSDSIQRALNQAANLELLTIVVCLEALFAAASLWHSTAPNALLRNTLLYSPLVVTTAALIAFTQFVMVNGPRIDLMLLGWSGLLAGLAGLVSITLLARLMRRHAADFLLELCLLLRLLAVLAAAAAIAVQLHRPAPELSFEPAGLGILAVTGTVFVLYGYLRRPHY